VFTTGYKLNLSAKLRSIIFFTRPIVNNLTQNKEPKWETHSQYFNLFQISNNDNIRHKYFSTDEDISMARYKLAPSFRVNQRDNLSDACSDRVQNTCQKNNVSIRVYIIHLGSCELENASSMFCRGRRIANAWKNLSGEKKHNYCQYWISVNMSINLHFIVWIIVEYCDARKKFNFMWFEESSNIVIFLFRLGNILYQTYSSKKWTGNCN
jgi:hypothetical protein